MQDFLNYRSCDQFQTQDNNAQGECSLDQSNMGIIEDDSNFELGLYSNLASNIAKTIAKNAQFWDFTFISPKKEEQPMLFENFDFSEKAGPYPNAESSEYEENSLCSQNTASTQPEAITVHPSKGRDSRHSEIIPTTNTENCQMISVYNGLVNSGAKVQVDSQYKGRKNSKYFKFILPEAIKVPLDEALEEEANKKLTVKKNKRNKDTPSVSQLKKTSLVKSQFSRNFAKQCLDKFCDFMHEKKNLKINRQLKDKMSGKKFSKILKDGLRIEDMKFDLNSDFLLFLEEFDINTIKRSKSELQTRYCHMIIAWQLKNVAQKIREEIATSSWGNYHLQLAHFWPEASIALIRN